MSETKTFYRFGRDRFSDSGPFTMRKVELLQTKTGWLANERIADLGYRKKIKNGWLHDLGWRVTEEEAKLARMEAIAANVDHTKAHLRRAEEDFALILEVLESKWHA